METGIAHSLQLLDYVLYYRGPRVRSVYARDFSTQCSDFFVVRQAPYKFCTGGSFPGCKAAGTSSLFLHHPAPKLQIV